MAKLGISIGPGLAQRAIITPQLQQAIKILHLSRLELEQYVNQQIEENPTLEDVAYEQSDDGGDSESNREATTEQFVDRGMDDAAKIVDSVDGQSKPDIDLEAYTSRDRESAAPTPSTVRKQNDEDIYNYENFVSSSTTLTEHLENQIGELDFSDEEKKIALLIIGNIDDRGYFSLPLDEFCGQENVDFETAEDVLDTLQRFDPPGVCARNLKECLMIQVRLGRMRNGIVEKIIENHLHELETRNFAAIAKRLGVSVDEVIANVQIISELEPIPGRQFGGENTQYVVPDVYVVKVGGEWRCVLNEDGLPKLKVSKLYSDMATSDAAQGKDKEYLKEKVKSAQWLIKSIHQRQSTILKVANEIVASQREFFEEGVEHLKPMILRDIAEKVGVHDSTISRVTNNKFMHTPRGVFELKYFFNSAVTRADGGESLASESVKHMIEQMVRAEDAKDPLSDQQIADILEERGIVLARRTVAKYREQLQILPSSKRKKYF